jgi:transposase InsO family protein
MRRWTRVCRCDSGTTTVPPSADNGITPVTCNATAGYVAAPTSGALPGRCAGSARASAGTMMTATTTWLIDRTTFVAVLASLTIGREKEAMRPIMVSVTKDSRGVIFHSDRGCQYTSTQYRRLADHHGVRLSVGRRGQCWDNAVAESFFATINTELLDRRPRPTPGRRPQGDLQLDRGLVQHPPPTLHTGLPQPRNLRGQHQPDRPTPSSLTPHRPCPSDRGNPSRRYARRSAPRRAAPTRHERRSIHRYRLCRLMFPKPGLYHGNSTHLSAHRGGAGRHRRPNRHQLATELIEERCGEVGRQPGPKWSDDAVVEKRNGASHARHPGP